MTSIEAEVKLRMKILHELKEQLDETKELAEELSLNEHVSPNLAPRRPLQPIQLNKPNILPSASPSALSPTSEIRILSLLARSVDDGEIEDLSQGDAWSNRLTSSRSAAEKRDHEVWVGLPVCRDDEEEGDCLNRRRASGSQSRHKTAYRRDMFILNRYIFLSFSVSDGIADNDSKRTR